MKVDIAVCTWNRADLLRQTLNSFLLLDIPTDCTVRFIVIDNNSTDETSDTLDSFREKLNLVTAVESEQGHTFSRNHAIRLADSELMLWTDDDVLVDRQWVSSYVAAARSNPEIDFWGGRILPRFDPVAPAWITENWEILKGCFAERDLGDDPVELNSARLPYGANFAIRTDLQKKFLFDPQLGRRKTEVMGEDEIDLFRRLLDAGHSGRWVPESRLEHIIPANRATEKYIFQYFVGQGESLIANGKAWTTSRLSLRSSAVFEWGMYLLKRRFASSSTWVSHLIRCGLATGQLRSIAMNR